LPLGQSLHSTTLGKNVGLDIETSTSVLDENRVSPIVVLNKVFYICELPLFCSNTELGNATAYSIFAEMCQYAVLLKKLSRVRNVWLCCYMNLCCRLPIMPLLSEISLYHVCVKLVFIALRELLLNLNFWTEKIQQKLVKTPDVIGNDCEYVTLCNRVD